MSVSKWAYEPTKCDNEYCPGDCDFCPKAKYSIEDEEEEDDEADAAGHFCRSLMSRAKNLEQSAHGIADALGIEI